MKITEMFQSKGFKITISVIGGLAILALVFFGGMSVGFRKAGFSYKFGNEHFDRLFGRKGPDRFPMMGFPGMMDDRYFLNSSGVAGQILSIGTNQIVVKDNQGVEKTVLISEKTDIRGGRQDLKLTDLKVNDQVTVFGSPDTAGKIQAALIRVFQLVNQK